MLRGLCQRCLRSGPSNLLLQRAASSGSNIRAVDSFAVVAINGKQYKVSAEDVVMAEKLEAEVGTQVVFDQVLLMGKSDGTTLIGQPTLEGASVSMTVQEQTHSAKASIALLRILYEPEVLQVDVFKKKRRKNYRRWNTHKQPITLLGVDELKFP